MNMLPADMMVNDVMFSVFLYFYMMLETYIQLTKWMSANLLL